jgi:hypothetical protein
VKSGLASVEAGETYAGWEALETANAFEVAEDTGFKLLKVNHIRDCLRPFG